MNDTIEEDRSICTSHVERHNLTIRTFMKRFTRLALGFSKKLENLAAATALQVAYYNFCWRPRMPGKTGKRRATPAMESGLTDRLWSLEDLYDAVVKQEKERVRAERINRLIDRLKRKPKRGE